MIRIRVASPGDAQAIADIYAPHVTKGTASFEDTAPDANTMRGRIAKLLAMYPFLVADEEGTVLGYAYADQFRTRSAYRWATETTVYVAPDAQRRGVGRLLYSALLDALRRQGFTQAIAAISLPNDPSIELHERAGFRRAGVYREVGWKHGRWIDVGLWQVQIADPSATPSNPLPFDPSWIGGGPA